MTTIDMLGTEIASKILEALAMESDNADENTKDMIPLDEQKRYLKRYIDTMSINDKKAIGNVLVMNSRKSDLKWCAEGTVINLDTLPTHVVEQMYNLMLFKITNRS